MLGRWIRCAVLGLALAWVGAWPGVWVGVGQAAGQTRQLTPVPAGDGGAVTIGLTTQPELRIGSMATVCFEVSRGGFVTLWNVATTGAVGRVYPNAVQMGGAREGVAMRVEAGRTCVGSGGDAFRFRVDGPAGTEDLYLLWTTRAELQPGRAAFADAGGLGAELGRVLGAADRGDWATAKATYDVVPAGGAVAPALPSALGGGGLADGGPGGRPGRVMLLAMGANVGRLSKTNQDAQLFTRSLSERFRIAREDVRLVANATKADFRAGLAWLGSRATRADMVVIYFSGHGGRTRDPTSEDGWDEYLVPYDSEVNRPPSGRDVIFSQELAAWINALPTDRVIAVADTCHSAGVYRAMEGDVLGGRSKLFVPPADMDMTRGVATGGVATGGPATRAAGGAGRLRAKGLLMAAARREQSAIETAEGGMFTMALIRQMQAMRGGSLAEAFSRAVEQTSVRSRGRQTPTAVGSIDVARLLTFAP